MQKNIKKIKVGLYDGDVVRNSRLVNIEGLELDDAVFTARGGALKLYQGFYNSVDCAYRTSYDTLKHIDKVFSESIHDYLSDTDNTDSKDVFVNFFDIYQTEHTIGIMLTKL